MEDEIEERTFTVELTQGEMQATLRSLQVSMDAFHRRINETKNEGVRQRTKVDYALAASATEAIRDVAMEAMAS